MPVSFQKISIGESYSRHTLAALWGYKSFHALARGVVTPADDQQIILFVTEDKQSSSEQYQDRLDGRILEWEGPKDHFAEERMLAAKNSGDEIHVFHRNIHHTDFSYLGEVTVVETKSRIGFPTQFKFELKES